MRGIYKMINAVGREIPEEVLKATGKEAFKGAYAYDNYEYTKAAPKAHTMMDPKRSKIVESIHDALVKCEIKDGMTISFHHHFREGDYVVNMVMDEIHKMGIKGITICARQMTRSFRTSRTAPSLASSLPVCAVRSVRRFPLVN